MPPQQRERRAGQRGPRSSGRSRCRSRARRSSALAADAEHDLLLKAVGVVAAVEAVGDRCGRAGSFCSRSVSSRRTGTAWPIGRRRARGARAGPRPGGPRSGRATMASSGVAQSAGSQGSGMLDLLARRRRSPGGDSPPGSASVTNTTGSSEVGAGAGGVAGEDAEAAGVGVHLRAQRDLHREVGHTGAWQKGIDRRHHWCPALIIAPKRFR